MQHWNKGLRLKGAAMSEKLDDIQQDFQDDPRAADHKESSRIFLQDSKNECRYIVEGSAPSETKKETAHGIRAMTVGALTTLELLPAPTGGR
jgi:hypothetical protein